MERRTQFALGVGLIVLVLVGFASGAIEWFLGLFGLEFTNQLLYDGVVFGLVYGLLALGIVLIYRSTRVINFAVGNMGLPGAVLFALMIFNWSFPFWIALAVTLAVGTLFGLIIDVAVIRRLFNSPRVILLVATIGVAQLALAIVFAYPDLDVSPGEKYPRFIGSEWADVFGTGVDTTGSELVVLLMVPVLAGLLSVFLYRTTVGQTVQAAADNPDLARLSGISPRIVSMLIWSIAGFLSTISMVMLSQLSGSTSAATFQNIGPNTMVRALAAAVIAGMRSFTLALVAGIGVGVTQALIRFNYLDQSGLVDFILFLAVLVAVFWQSRTEEQTTQSSFSFAPKIKAIPARLRGINSALVGLLGIVALAIAIITPLIVDTPSRHFLYASIVAFAVCAASVTVITGWSGQLSLGQMAFAGLGALGAAALTRGVELDIFFIDVQFEPIPFVLAVFVVPLFTAVLAALIGIGGLRVRGLMLAVTTFAFGLAAQQYIYRRPIFSDGNSQSVPFDRGAFFGIELTSQRAYYFFSLAVLVLVLAVLARLRKSGVGRTIIAVRDNPDSAAAYTVAPTRTKLVAFAMAGGIAGLGGAVLGGLVRNIPFTRAVLPHRRLAAPGGDGGHRRAGIGGRPGDRRPVGAGVAGLLPRQRGRPAAHLQHRVAGPVAVLPRWLRADLLLGARQVDALARGSAAGGSAQDVARTSPVDPNQWRSTVAARGRPDHAEGERALRGQPRGERCHRRGTGRRGGGPDRHQRRGQVHAHERGRRVRHLHRNRRADGPRRVPSATRVAARGLVSAGPSRPRCSSPS